MKNNLWIQKGYNCLWPYEIETWRWGEPIPEWLSDRAGIEWIDGDGNMTLKTRPLSTGGVEILKAEGSEVLVQLKDLKDLVYISPLKPQREKFPPELRDILPPITKEPRTITLPQLKLLYRSKK